MCAGRGCARTSPRGGRAATPVPAAAPRHFPPARNCIFFAEQYLRLHVYDRCETARNFALRANPSQPGAAKSTAVLPNFIFFRRAFLSSFFHLHSLRTRPPAPTFRGQRASGPEHTYETSQAPANAAARPRRACRPRSEEPLLDVFFRIVRFTRTVAAHS